jgi:hypothetical protein
MNLRKALESEKQNKEILHHDADTLLGYLYEEAVLGRATFVTTLVHQQCFGAPPTILRRIKELSAAGLIESYVGKDKRQRCLRVSLKGEAYLAECSALLRRAVNGEDDCASLA